LHPGGEEIAGRIAKAHRINNRYRRDVIASMRMLSFSIPLDETATTDCSKA
jgi:head-tail adaptor